MLPQEKVKNLIDRHLKLEKELSTGEIDKKKYAEVAACMISFDTLKNGKLKELRKSLRTYDDEFVGPLNRIESFFLWTRGFLLALWRKIGMR